MATQRVFRFPTGKFIAEIKCHRCLYDKSLPNYKDTALKRTLWSEIGQKFGITGKECETKWKNLKDRCVKEQKNGSGQPTWEYFEEVKTIMGMSGNISKSTPATSGSSPSHPATTPGMIYVMYKDDDAPDGSGMVSSLKLLEEDSTEVCSARPPSETGKRLQENSNDAGRSKKHKESNSPVEEPLQRSPEACSGRLESVQPDRDDSHHFCQYLATRLRGLSKSKRREAFLQIECVMYDLETGDDNG